MSKKIKKIFKVFENYNKDENKQISVFCRGFKATGKIHLPVKIKNILTIEDAKVFSNAINCECDDLPTEYEQLKWINIFAQDIIAFSIHE